MLQYLIVFLLILLHTEQDISLKHKSRIQFKSANKSKLSLNNPHVYFTKMPISVTLKNTMFNTYAKVILLEIKLILQFLVNMLEPANWWRKHLQRKHVKSPLLWDTTFWSIDVIFLVKWTRGLDIVFISASTLHLTMPPPDEILRFPLQLSPSSWPGSGCEPQLPVSSFLNWSPAHSHAPWN